MKYGALCVSVAGTFRVALRRTRSPDRDPYFQVSGLILNPVATDKLGQAAGGGEGMLPHGFTLFKKYP